MIEESCRTESAQVGCLEEEDCKRDLNKLVRFPPTFRYTVFWFAHVFEVSNRTFKDKTGKDTGIKVNKTIAVPTLICGSESCGRKTQTRSYKAVKGVQREAEQGTRT